MPRATFTIEDSFAIKNRGTVLCMRPDATGMSLAVGAIAELRRPDGSVFRSRVKGIEMWMVSPPPPPGMQAPIGVLLADDPGPVPSGSELHVG